MSAEVTRTGNEFGANPVQEAEQPKPRRGNPNWAAGTSQNPAGKESKAARQARREAIIREWAEPFVGGMAMLQPAELALLHQAAELVLRNPRMRTAEDAVRCANTVSRILAQVGFVDRRPREPLDPGERHLIELRRKVEAAERGLVER
jgi:hypothetical protein